MNQESPLSGDKEVIVDANIFIAIGNRLTNEGLVNLSTELAAITERFYDGRDRLTNGSTSTLWAERYRR
jgi:hypothetical protein